MLKRKLRNQPNKKKTTTTILECQNGVKILLYLPIFLWQSLNKPYPSKTPIFLCTKQLSFIFQLQIQSHLLLLFTLHPLSEQRHVHFFNPHFPPHSNPSSPSSLLTLPYQLLPSHPPTFPPYPLLPPPSAAPPGASRHLDRREGGQVR